MAVWSGSGGEVTCPSHDRSYWMTLLYGSLVVKVRVFRKTPGAVGVQATSTCSDWPGFKVVAGLLGAWPAAASISPQAGPIVPGLELTTSGMGPGLFTSTPVCAVCPGGGMGMSTGPGSCLAEACPPEPTDTQRNS